MLNTAHPSPATLLQYQDWDASAKGGLERLQMLLQKQVLASYCHFKI